MILVAEGFPLRVYGKETEHRGVERVHALKGGGAGVGLFSYVIYELGGEAVVVGGGACGVFVVDDGGVLHYGGVYVIKFAESQELLLAGDEPQLTLVAQLLAVGDLNAFLGGNAHHNHITAEISGNIRVCQRHCYRESRGKLSIVAAGVYGVSQRVGVLMSGHEYSVQLTHDGDARIVLRALLLRNDARDGDPGARLIAQRFQLAGKFCGGLDLLEAKLRLAGHGVGKGKDIVPARVDGPAGNAFQLFLTSQSISPLLKNVRPAQRPPEKICCYNTLPYLICPCIIFIAMHFMRICIKS